MPLFSNDGELCYMYDAGSEFIIYSLKDQYKSQEELLALLDFLATLEKMGFL